MPILVMHRGTEASGTGRSGTHNGIGRLIFNF
jgi:hypothetical protein